MGRKDQNSRDRTPDAEEQKRTENRKLTDKEKKTSTGADRQGQKY